MISWMEMIASRGRRMISYCSRVTARYHAILPQIICFWFDQKLKNHEVTLTLHTFEPSAARLQCPWLRSTTNLVHCQSAIVSFFALNRTHCHLPTWTWLSGNHMQPMKLLNESKYHTATTSLHGPFLPGWYSVAYIILEPLISGLHLGYLSRGGHLSTTVILRGAIMTLYFVHESR